MHVLGDQRLGIPVTWVRQYFPGGSALDDAAGEQDLHRVAGLPEESEVLRHEHERNVVRLENAGEEGSIGLRRGFPWQIAGLIDDHHPGPLLQGPADRVPLAAHGVGRVRYLRHGH